MLLRITWLVVAACLMGGIAVLAAALAHVPSDERGSLAIEALLVLGVTAMIAGGLAAMVANRLARPLRRIAQALQQERLSDDTSYALPRYDAFAEATDLVTALVGTRERLRTTIEDLRRDRAEVATIIQHMDDGLVVLDADERVERVNERAVSLLREHRAAGKYFAAVARDPDLVQLARAARHGTPVTQVIELRTNPRSPRVWIQATATRLPGKEPERTLLLMRDVTEFRRVEAARRDFVANLSHELRTPIASLKALVETLEDGATSDPEAGPEFLRRIHVEVDGLAHMVSELLELARVEAGRIDLEPAICSAQEIMRAAVDRMGPFAARRGVEMELVAESADDLFVSLDPHRIGQVFANLLANATKFTPPGGRVEVGARDANSSVEFWVRDTGIGIPAESLARVFERFYKTDPSRTSEGTGLGLAICKHLVLAHGGRIWAESDGPGRGATFRFRLPKKATDSPSERKVAVGGISGKRSVDTVRT